jgi:predicted anti-sigma-YlaC factor YlaD
MDCDEIREMLPAYVKDDKSLLSVRRHLAECRDCREELARYEAVLDGLGALNQMTMDPPPNLLRNLTEAPFTVGRVERAKTHVVHNRGVYLSGAAVGVTGVVGAAAWLLRSRRLAAA